MIKYVEQSTWEDGTPVVQLLRASPEYQRGLEKIASNVHEDVRDFTAKLKPRPDCVYVLVNALGAGEFYGSNLNADYFNEVDLIGDSAGSTGHKTFLTAGVFRYHVNKDISRTLGKVLLAVYNHRMHRVELILEVEKRLCEDCGHGDLYDRLSRGDSTPVSMGCRVKFDKCAKCGFESESPSIRCECMRTSANAVLEDGVKVYVRNPNPRFFDISFVTVNADAIGHSMTKLAYARKANTLAVELRDSLQKAADASKLAELLKRVPAVGVPAFKNVKRSEQDIPYEHLMRIAQEAGSPSTALSSLAAGGVALSPREFQTVVMIFSGDSSDARRLYDANATFGVPSQTWEMSPLLAANNVSPLHAMAPVLPARSGLEDFLIPRLLSSISVQPSENFRSVDNPLLQSLGPAYNSYRLECVRKAPSLALSSTYGNNMESSYCPVMRGFMLLSGRRSYDEGGTLVPLAREESIASDLLRGLGSLSRNIITR